MLRSCLIFHVTIGQCGGFYLSPFNVKGVRNVETGNESDYQILTSMNILENNANPKKHPKEFAVIVDFLDSLFFIFMFTIFSRSHMQLTSPPFPSPILRYSHK